MNKKGGSEVANETVFNIIFILLFTGALLYSVNFIENREVRRVDFNELEDSIVINRVVSCISGDVFGELDMNKFTEAELRKCLVNEDYDFSMELTGKNPIKIGDQSWSKDFRISKRYVLVDGEGAKLKVGYRKNVPR